MGGVVVIVRIFCKAASPIRIGFNEFLFNVEEFLTAGIIIAPDDVFAIDDAVKIREDDKSIFCFYKKIIFEQIIVHNR
jgi:hypothetical protein